MAKLLYLSDDGKTYEVTRDVLDQLVADAKAKATQVLTKTGDAQQALTSFEDEMKRLNVRIGIYKNRFGNPYSDQEQAT
jgi:hypothetical protein